MDSHHLNEARRSLSFRLDPRRSADSPPRYDAVTAKNVVEFGQRLDRFALGLAAVGNGAVNPVDRLLQFCTMAHEQGYDGCFGCVHNSKCKCVPEPRQETPGNTRQRSTPTHHAVGMLSIITAPIAAGQSAS